MAQLRVPLPPHSEVQPVADVLRLDADLARAWGREPLVLSQGEVHPRYTEGDDPATHPISRGNNGARGGSRTHMRKNPRRILSPQRLPFRHPGTGQN